LLPLRATTPSPQQWRTWTQSIADNGPYSHRISCDADESVVLPRLRPKYTIPEGPKFDLTRRRAGLRRAAEIGGKFCLVLSPASIFLRTRGTLREAKFPKRVEHRSMVARETMRGERQSTGQWGVNGISGESLFTGQCGGQQARFSKTRHLHGSCQLQANDLAQLDSGHEDQGSDRRRGWLWMGPSGRRLEATSSRGHRA
jgi:hypothetical protein